MIVLIVGATRGLGHSLANQYIEQGATVYGTTRKKASKESDINKINWIENVDIGQHSAAGNVIKGYDSSHSIDLIIISAGYFGKESFEDLDWEGQETMYRTSAIGPVFLVSGLAKAGLLKRGTKIVMVSSESGSITLRHEKEGGGNYGHHASKAALNMVTKLLSLDLKDKGVIVVSVHPSFMRTEMTKSVGFDEVWDDGGAVTPDVAARSMIEWIATKLDITKTGEYWAPRGPGDIGTADVVLGPTDQLPTPLQLPW